MKIVLSFVGILAAFTGYYLVRYYPAIAFQWVVFLVLYWLGLKIVHHFFKPEKEKDKKRGKLSLILTLLGLSGLISPILGVIFTLPAVLISSESINKDYSGRKRLIVFSWLVLIVCVLNANLGMYLNQIGQ